MRKIKFRIPVFNKDGFQQFNYMEFEPQKYNGWGGTKLTGDYFYGEPQEFCGLLDKQGREIYEGDIVQRHNVKKIVKWIDGKSMCGWNIGVGYGYKGNTIEVIGNIYEQTELPTPGKM